MKFIRKSLGLLVAAVLSVAMAAPAHAAGTADVLFVVDESGSMSGEHAWIASMVSSLDAELTTAGVTGNRFGLVGFGGAGGLEPGHKIAVGGGDWGTAAQLGAATGSLTTGGGFEDGWDGIDTALNDYSFRVGAAINVILITDEDRDADNLALTYASVLADLNAKGAILNAVVAHGFNVDGGVNNGIGILGDGTGFKEGAGGTYTSHAGSTFGTDDGGGGFGGATTKADYIDMAHATGGAGWDLAKLRAGGNSADSFTAAFVDVKVQEIVRQNVVPEPGTYALFGVAALGYAFVRRRRRNAA